MAFATALIVVLVFLQSDGYFIQRTPLTMLASRAGLQMESGTKATFNGVQIGRVGAGNAVEVGGKTKAKLTLEVDHRYLALIPENVEATISAATVSATGTCP
jgi:phospholipid/cholesterol/gamma-HCH transport system substrate-binding protein